MTKTIINREISVSSFSFNKQFEALPRRIEFEGRSLTFLGSGIRFLIKNNGHIIRLFDMSDGEAEYRLRCDNGTAWTLVTIRQ